MTKEQLDERLRQVSHPGPVIVVGPAHPIRSFEGWGDPYEDHYRGARVIVHPGLGEDCIVEEVAQ